MKNKIVIVVIIVIALLCVGLIIINGKETKAMNVIKDDLKVATGDLKISNDDIEIISEKRELDDFKIVYDVKFNYNNHKYEYQINLLNNVIVKRKFYEKKPMTDEQAIMFNQDKAIETALNHANIAKDKVDNILVEEELENGLKKYDIEFYYDKYKYEYTIDENGKIIEYEKEKVD